ncbi:hypothetical protein Golob_027558, partial [Gossypium lobatum]|nr:hypothetical protein [Gossypium lobatum]
TLVPTVEEYTTLLYCPKIQANKTYSRAANETNEHHKDKRA